MPQYVEVNGNTIEFPDGMPAPEIEKAIKANLASIKPAAAVSAGKEINAIPRQLGLTARYGLEGLANTAQIVTEPIRNALAGLSRAVPMRGEGGADNPLMMDRKAAAPMIPLGQGVTNLATAAGLPSPQGANERVVADATRLMAGAGGMGAAARSASSLPGLVGQAGEFLSANMGQQLASAAGAGLAGGASREAGGGAAMQAGAALLGGVGAGMGVQAAGNVANKAVAGAKRMMPGQQQLVQQRLDQRINIVLESQGIDPATVTPAMRTALREQVGRAMDMGDLNPQAVARLADYTRLNMTPTRARLTLDPYDVTQEANASKLAAATGSREALLPQIANNNNRRLVGMIDDMGGARPVDTYGQGSAVTRTIAAQDDRLNTQVRSAYDAYRNSTGRDLPIPLGPLKDGYRTTLKDFGDDLIPSAVRNKFEAIVNPPRPHSHGHGAPAAAPQPPQTIVDTSGRTLIDLTPKPPQKQLSIDEAEMLIKTINYNYNPANLPQARALDRLRNSVQQSIIGATEDGAGMESATLANFARSAARDRFQWRDSSPVIQRAIDGAIPDTFIQQNIISKAAGFDGVARAAETINANPAAREAVRTSIVQHLKDSAIGKGGTSQTGNFSGRGMEAALKAIGDRKLGLFFEPGEIETLKAMARTGSFEVFQPRGSAVNNSNSAAGIAAIVSSLADRVRPVANKIPFGEMAISGPLDNLAVWAMQRPTQNIPQGLLMPQARRPLVGGLLLPGVAAGGTAAGLLTP
jgi:hypothetical protein